MGDTVASLQSLLSYYLFAECSILLSPLQGGTFESKIRVEMTGLGSL